MGTVWLAEHTVMNRMVAVKVIRPDLLARPGATGRFLREVRAAAKLHHRNIVTAFDAEQAGDSCLLVMEYVEGKTLADLIHFGPLPVPAACQAISDAARGLAAAHAAGLVHRDVKPHNLIQASDGTVKVLDFGLTGVASGEIVAANGDGLTGAGMVVGTPAYIAPEQIVDPHSADARADIYGLGCTLYHLLSGRPPVSDGSIAEILALQQTREPEPIPGLPEHLARVLMKMLAKRPEERFQSADEVVEALQPFCGDFVTPRRNWWSCSNNPWVMAGTLLFALIVIAGSVVYKIHRDNQEITISTDDPDIEVVMKRKGEVVLIRDAKSGQTWTYDTIKNEIGQAGLPDGLKLPLMKEPFVLRRSDRDVFKVTRLTMPASETAEASEAKLEAAVRAAEAWLKLIDAGKYTEAWEEAAAITRKSIPKEQVIQGHQELARKNGKRLTRSLAGREFERMASGALSPNHVLLTYHTNFEFVGARNETLGCVLEADGRWRVETWRVDPTRVPSAVPANPPAVPRLRQTIHENGFPQRIVYTPDGKTILAAGRAYFAIHDAATGKSIFYDSLGAAGFTTDLDVSPDSRTAAVESYGDVHVFDLVTRKRVATIPRRTKDNSVIPVTTLAVAPDGKTVAFAAGGEIVLYDLTTKKADPIRSGLGRSIYGMRFSPDGRHLVHALHVETEHLTRVVIIDAKTHKEIAKRDLEGGFFGTAIRFSTDGKRLFVCGTRSAGRQQAFVVLWMPSAEVFERELFLPDGTGAPIASPDGILLAVAGKDGDVQIWDRGKKRVVASWTPHPDAQPEFGPRVGKAPPMWTSVAFGPDGRTLATARGSLIGVWDLDARTPASTTAPDKELILGSWRGVATEIGGQPMPQEFIDTMKPTLTFTADKVSGKTHGTFPKPFLEMAVSKSMLPKEAAAIVEKGLEGIYHLDSTKSPKTIDIITLGEARKTGLGLYTLDGDTLKLCLSIDPEKVSERPTEFVSKAGVLQVIVTLKRLTPKDLILEDIERRIDPANGDGKGLPVALMEQDGAAVLRFGKWRVVYEGVACDSGGKVLFGVGSLFFPESGGRGNFVDPGLKPPAPALRQQWDGRANEILVKNYRFEMEAKGARLVFADKSYEATDRVQTIVIARDGTTRLDAPAAKK